MEVTAFYVMGLGLTIAYVGLMASAATDAVRPPTWIMASVVFGVLVCLFGCAMLAIDTTRVIDHAL